MNRMFLTLAALVLVLILADRLRGVEAEVKEDAAIETSDVPMVMPSTPGPAKDDLTTTSAAPDRAAPAAFIPTFFPKAKVVAQVADPVDAKGRERVIETVETGMREKYVRVERSFTRDAQGVLHKASADLAMVANQLLLEKPTGLTTAAFTLLLKQAGAIDVKPIGEAFLATFQAKPEDPRALDAYMSKVREVAGARVTVEPNYIRKLF
jgi:hypothetical protein